MNLHKRTLSLAVIMALGLSGCGSEGGSDPQPDPQNGTPNPTEPTPPSGEPFTIKAIDGYLKGAKVHSSSACIDELGTTDYKGEATFDKNYSEGVICVLADPMHTFDMGRGTYVKDNFRLRGQKGSQVITPITSLIVDQMEADNELALTTAKQNIVTAVSHGGAQVSEALLFGDYTTTDTVDANAVELLAETLVDIQTNEETRDMEIDVKMVATENISKDIVETIAANNGTLPNDYAPVVDKNGNVISNYRPELIDGYEYPTVEYYEVEYGHHITLTPMNVEGWFKDKDGDTITYEVESTYEGQRVPNEYSPYYPSESRIFIDGNNNVAGYIQRSGTYTVNVFGLDKNTKSEPVTYQIVVETKNQAPQKDASVEGDIQKDLNAITFTANEAIAAGTSVSIAGLFVDPDGDALKYTVQHDSMATITVVDDQLVFDGAFGAKDEGSLLINVVAADEITTPASASFGILVSPPLIENTAPEIVSEESQNLRNDVDMWELKEGTQTNYTIDATLLFDDKDDDELTYWASSTLEKERDGQTSTGFNVLVSEDGEISFAGLIPRDGSSEKIIIWANDGLVNSSKITMPLPTIEERDPEVKDPLTDARALEDTMWFYLDNGGTINSYQNKAQCKSIYFDSSEKVAYENTVGSSIETECRGNNHQNFEGYSAVGEYVVRGDTVVITSTDKAYKATEHKDELSTGALEVRYHNYQSVLTDSTYVMHKSPVEVEKALGFVYDGNGQIVKGTFKTELISDFYTDVTVEINADSSVGAHTPVLVFSGQQTCFEVMKTYYNFELVNDKDEPVSGVCNDDNGNVTFTFGQWLEPLEMNSIIGHVRVDSHPEFNMSIKRKLFK
ncbi:hypothetical protein [Vibrio crassostreae]|uniref:hypothetical protein n=1 Tax=Vibrio crassostreae TaxID=246167 RepID=UPI001B30C3CB|nr:hypothetical protein [Vibrio crassostreae]